MFAETLTRRRRGPWYMAWPLPRRRRKDHAAVWAVVVGDAIARRRDSATWCRCGRGRESCAVSIEVLRNLIDRRVQNISHTHLIANNLLFDTQDLKTTWLHAKATATCWAG